MQQKPGLLNSPQIYWLITAIMLLGCNSQKKAVVERNSENAMHLADPTLLKVDATYYAYGTAGDHLTQPGFPVYASKDLRTWKAVPGNLQALTAGDSYGKKGFWAPQVLPWGSRYLMAYTANEQIAIAYSDNPGGPFKQNQPFHALFGDPYKHIDPFILQDSGKTYLYYVKLDQGNKIFVSEVHTNIKNHRAKTRASSQTPANTVFEVIAGTERLCIEAKAGWENTVKSDWPVTEGPTVIKHKGRYYLFYSANDFRNPDYAVGYAVSTSPMGPWIKSAQNPIISKKNTGIAGTGHGDVFQDNKGQYYYIFHAHNSDTAVSPRRTMLIPFRFENSSKQHQANKSTQTAPDQILVNTTKVRSLFLHS